MISGEPIRGWRETPETLDLQDNDQIDVFLAMCGC